MKKYTVHYYYKTKENSGVRRSSIAVEGHDQFEAAEKVRSLYSNYFFEITITSVEEV